MKKIELPIMVNIPDELMGLDAKEEDWDVVCDSGMDGIRYFTKRIDKLENDMS